MSQRHHESPKAGSVVVVAFSEPPLPGLLDGRSGDDHLVGVVTVGLLAAEDDGLVAVRVSATVEFDDVGLENAEAHQDLATQAGAEQVVEAQKGVDVVHQRNAVGVVDDDTAVFALR